MELEIAFSGIGGQGIQLMAKTLALAATRQGMHAMLAADYGGEMRGGPSKSVVVIGDGPLTALPMLTAPAVIVLMHHRFSEHVVERTKRGGHALLNVPLVDAGSVPDHLFTATVDSAAVAAAAGSAQGAGLAALGCLNGLTAWFPVDALVSAMSQLLPVYRQQHVPSNSRAIAGGQAWSDELGLTTWRQMSVGSVPAMSAAGQGI